MNKIAEFIKQKSKWSYSGRICDSFRIGIKICPGIGAGKRNSKNG